MSVQLHLFCTLPGPLNKSINEIGLQTLNPGAFVQMKPVQDTVTSHLLVQLGRPECIDFPAHINQPALDILPAER